MSTVAVVLLVLLTSCMPLAAAPGIAEGELLVSDDFSRLARAGEDLNGPPDTAYRWLRRVPVRGGLPATGIVSGAEGQAIVRYSSADAPQDTGLWLEGFTVADAALETLVGPSLMAGHGGG